MNIAELARALIDVPSVTGDEAAVGGFLGSLLESLGYEVELQSVEAERSNVFATTSKSPRVVFSTHLDTVPPFIPSFEDEEFIYGRGACDAKGIIAAQISAAEALRAEGTDEIGLLFTVDEEASSAGARVANGHPRAHECLYLINGEPTDNKLAVGTKGSLRLSLHTSGHAAHSAYPEQGDSAIERMLDVLADLREIKSPVDEFFGETTCNIGVLTGGTRANVVAADASAILQIRLANDVASTRRLIERSVKGRARINWLSENEPLRLTEVEGFETCVVRFTTDIPYLTNWGTPLLIGPGSILVAHTDEEHISKLELAEAVELYARLGRGLVARTRTEDSMMRGVRA